MRLGKREIGKWWFFLAIDRDFIGNYPGWKRFNFAIIKLVSRPPQGSCFTKENYKGFWIKFLFWMPIERTM
jgi:hypothetical protein